MSQIPEARLRESTEKMVRILAYVVCEGTYGPVDRLARAADISAVMLSLYEAFRIISTELRRRETEEQKTGESPKVQLPSLPTEEEVKLFVEAIEKGGARLARKVAFEALVRGLRCAEERKAKESQKSGGKTDK